jgi:hypothetical protein
LVEVLAMRTSMSAVDCPFCGANLPPGELAEGWCETCGKKLPASLRGLGAAGSGRPLSPEEVPARSPSGLRTGLGVLAIFGGPLLFLIELSKLPTILREWPDDPYQAAGRLIGTLTFPWLLFGLGLHALLGKDQTRSPRMRDHWSQGEVPSRKRFPVVLWILGLVVGLPFLACAGFASLGVKMPSMVSNGTTIKSKDGSIQMRVPAGWALATDLNDRAVLQAQSRRNKVGLVVLTELKTDLRKGMTYREASELALHKFLKKVSEGKFVRGPTDLVIDARPALQYEIHGLVKNARFAALHTTIDGRDSFHQVLVFTTPSGLRRNRTTLEEIINSFTEIK